MSWLSSISSKAEAMLVRLDQDAAQALQNPDQILKPVAKIFEGTRENEGTSSTRENENEFLIRNQSEETIDIDTSPEEIHRVDPVAENSTILDQGNVTGIHYVGNDVLLADSQQQIRDSTPPVHEPGRPVSNGPVDGLEQGSPGELHSKSGPKHPGQFKLHITKLRRPLWDQSLQESTNSSFINSNGRQKTTRLYTTPMSPEADDIRASINRSLQEYSQSSSKDYSNRRDRFDDQTTYTSHFDSRPNVISHSPSSGSDYDDGSNPSRLRSSPSFSIDIPNDDTRHTSDEGRTNITNHILRQSALKKPSAFNLQKVINKLSSQRAQSQPLIGDKTKLRLKRAQMRVASHLRRLNYYFRTHPSMKYWMLGYLVLLQILVIYVLFFYQSSSSSNYLASQVEQQQEELIGSKLKSNSEKLPLQSITVR